MYLYRVGYGTYEESEHVALSHEKSFTKEDFRKLVVETTVDVVKFVIQKKEEEKDIENEDDKEYTDYYLHSFQDVLDDVIKKMIEEHGFSRVEYRAQFSVFGWASLFDKGDWETETKMDVGLNSIRQRLSEEGFSRKNDTFLNELDRVRSE